MMFTKWSTGSSNPVRRTLRFGAALAVSASLALTSACSLLPAEDIEEELPTITPPRLSEKPTYTVTRETMEAKVQAIGKLMSEREESLFFAGGEEVATGDLRVKEIHVESGESVTAGQLLMELDVTEKVRELRRAELEFRKEELAMIEILRKANEYSPEELEQYKIEFELKRTSLTELREVIADAQLTAPYDGTIVSVNVERGATVEAYDTVAVIADLSQLVVTADFSADALREIAVGMETTVDISSAGTHKGKVERLPTKTDEDPNNGGGFPGYPGGGQEPEQDSVDNYLLVELDAFPEGVTRGTPLSVTVITNRKENVTVIPPATLRSYNGRSYVQVVDEQGNKREVDVEVGMRTATQVEVLKGLEPGQKVVGQ